MKSMHSEESLISSFFPETYEDKDKDDDEVTAPTTISSSDLLTLDEI